jgi:hypothetical protein
MHGVHVASGLIALVYLGAQVIVMGLHAAVLRRLLCWSLARAGHCLGRGIHVGLSDGSTLMDGSDRLFEDRTPGVEEREPTASYLSYTADWALRFWRRSPLSLCHRPTCFGPLASRSD